MPLQEFWDKLNRGEYISASFKRVGKGGKEVWIQASYNPILGMDGRVLMIVKFASGITALTRIGEGLARLADNDLEHQITSSFSSAFEKLRLDFNLAHSNPRSTLLQVANSTEAIRSGSGEISHAADDLSKRTEQQANPARVQHSGATRGHVVRASPRGNLTVESRPEDDSQEF